MIEDTIKTEILRRIKSAEAEHNVKVLYAVESGSRAWGFASPNSDYDVRFIYAHPKDWYVAVDLEEKRDVIEYPIVDEIDINGWDVRKALQLFRKSNPAFVEWLQSPIVYVDDGRFAPQARDLLKRVYSVEKGIYHYRSMAKTNFRSYLREEQVPIKKYFYVLKPLLSIKWLQRFDQPAPIEFDKLLAMVADEPELSETLNALVARKRISLEKEYAPSIPILNAFIEKELAGLENGNFASPSATLPMEDINALFRSSVR